MSVPRGNFKKLNSLLKQESLKKAHNPLQGEGKKKKQSKTDRKGGKREKYRPLRGKNDRDKLKKSKHNFLPDTFSNVTSTTISPTDHASIKNQVNPTFSSSFFSTQHSDVLSQGHKNNFHDPHFSTTAHRGDKKKSGRRGKNANEFPDLTPYISSGGSGFTGNAFLNQNEEVLRRKILAKVDALDPLMCLPKVLCGYSSRRRRHKNNTRRKTTTTTTTSTTHRPLTNEAIIEEYLSLLGIIPPIQKDNVEYNLKKADMYLKSEKYLKKSSKEKKKVERSKKKIKKYESEEDDTQQDQASDSASASAESDEAPSRYHKHNRYPIHDRRPYWPSPAKFLFNRKKNSEENEEDNDDDSSSSSVMNDEDYQEDNLMSDEHVGYVVKKAKMQKLMQSGSHSDENWWEPFDQVKVQVPTQATWDPYYYPPTQPTWDHPLPDDILSVNDEDEGSITGWFTNMFSSFMPRISWGGKEKKEDFAIKDDPFFTSFDGRGFTHGKGRSLHSSSSSSYKDKLKLAAATIISSSTQPKLGGRKGKLLDLEQFLNVRPNSKQLDYNPGDSSNPAAKYRTAVEIGTRVTTPSQCDFIYNGCPLSYEEILAIINEPEIQEPISTATKRPSLEYTTTTNYYPTINKMTPPPRQIVVPLHQQQQLPYQPPQALVIHQHEQQPQYQILHPQHQSSQEHAQILYNQQLRQQQQQQLANLQYMLQNPQFQQQSPLLSNLDGMMSNKPHKTKIHQALPSGEVEINFQYHLDKMGKSDLPQGNTMEGSSNVDTVQNMETAEETPHNSYSAAASASTSYEHNPQQQQHTNHFSHKVLTNYEFFPSNGYKIRRKNGEMEKSVTSKNAGVVSNTIKLGGDSSGSSLFSASDESNNNMEVLSPPVPEKSSSTEIKRRRQRIPSRTTTYNNNSKGKKYQRKQLFKSTSSSAPPLRHSFNRQNIQQQQVSQEKRKRKGNGNNMKIRRKTYSGEKRKKKKKAEVSTDDNSSGNSGSNNSNTDSSSGSASNERLQYDKSEPGAEYLERMNTTQERNRLKKKKRRKSHLHKQSSDSNEAKKRLEIAAPNAIYPIYGHPFPPPYASYYHTVYPSTPTSPSFFSYFFGR